LPSIATSLVVSIIAREVKRHPILAGMMQLAGQPSVEVFRFLPSQSPKVQETALAALPGQSNNSSASKVRLAIIATAIARPVNRPK